VRAGCVAALLFLAASTISADQFDGQPIAGITVSGLRDIKEAVVVQQIESQPGRTYYETTAAEDVRRLQRLRVFSEVTITPVPVEGGVRLEVAVVETLRILPAVSIGVSDASGTSIGPALKVLSVAGHPHEVSASVRFGVRCAAQPTSWDLRHAELHQLAALYRRWRRACRHGLWEHCKKQRFQFWFAAKDRSAVFPKNYQPQLSGFLEER